MPRTLFSLVVLIAIVSACASEDGAQNANGPSPVTLRVSDGTGSVDLKEASLAWDWTPDSGGDVRKFMVKCASTDGRSLTLHPMEASARAVPLKDVIAGPGRYRCVVTAENQAGEFRPTNEVRFRVVDQPKTS